MRQTLILDYQPSLWAVSYGLTRKRLSEANEEITWIKKRFLGQYL
jgi:hypothetical protein